MGSGFSDAVFQISDDADATKKLAFQLSGIATATTRTITAPDLSGTMALTAGAQTLTDKRISPRVVALTDAATIAVVGDTTDIGTVTIAGNRVVGAPTGTPVNGQPLVLRVTQDATGGRVLTFNAAFTFQQALPAPNLDANTTAIYKFRYNSTTSTWQQDDLPLGVPIYAGKIITGNTVAIVRPNPAGGAGTVPVAGDYVEIDAAIKAAAGPGYDVTNPPINGVATLGTTGFTIPVTGVYKFDAYASASQSALNSAIYFNSRVNGVNTTARPGIIWQDTAGGIYHTAVHAYFALTAGDTFERSVATSNAGNVTIKDLRFSLQLVERTA